MFKFRKNNKGAAMIIAAVIIPVLMGLAALMVDVGVAFSAKSRIEYVAVQAVEAAEMKLPDGVLAQSYAESLANEMLKSTLTYAENPVVTATSDGTEVSVEIQVDTRAFFAPVLGITDLTVRAGAARP